MRRELTSLTLCLLLTTVPAKAVTIDWDASLRLRSELKNDLNLSEARQNYSLLRTRIGADFTFAPQWSLTTELQDSRVFGVEANTIPNVNDGAIDQPFADDLDVHRFSLNYSSNKLAIKLGRQKLNLGDKRLVASLEWVNTARVHDGIRLDYKTDNREINIFATELVSIDPGALNDGADTGNRYFDSQFNGVFITQRNIAELDLLQAWWFQRRNSNFADDVHTLGFRLQEQFSSWTVEAQASIQTGNFDGEDHQAAMLQASIARQIGKGVASASVAWASGDSDPDDGEHQTFDNLYPLNHAYYGDIDLISLQNLRTIELNYRRSLFNEKLKFRAALHGFWLDDINDVWYEAGLNPVAGLLISPDRIDISERFLGSELDLSMQYAVKIRGLSETNLLVGYSYFDAGNRVLADPQNGLLSDTDFVYLQLTLKL